MKKILITTLFLCSLFALNAQVHPTEPNFLTTTTKPAMRKYIMQLDMEVEKMQDIPFQKVDESWRMIAEKYDMEYFIQSVEMNKSVTYRFLTNDPRVFVELGYMLATWHQASAILQTEQN